MKKKLLLVLQISITIGILCWIFRDPVKRAQFADGLGKIDYGWLALAIPFLGLQFVFGTIRWFLLLRVQDFQLTLKRVGAITLVGHFFSLFLPGGTGGDILRAWYLFREAPERKTVGLLTIVMDRIIGLLAMIGISAVVIAMRYQWLTQTPGTSKLLGVLIFLLVSSLGMIVTALLITSFKLQHKLPQKMPARERLIELASALDLYARRPGTALAALILSGLGHAVYFTDFYLLTRAFGLNVPFLDVVSVVPVIAVIAALPISFSGVGVRETVSQEMLALCHVEPGLAILVSTFSFVCIFSWAVAGGIVFLFYKPSGHISLREMQEDFKEAEHHVAD